MYSIFESVINKGGYKLGDMLNRIETYAAEGKLTIEEMGKLEARARERAKVQDDTDILHMLLDHEARIRVLEAKHVTEENDDAIIPEYVSGKWYYNGDIVMYKGETYTCIAPDGVVCVWNPDDYPAYWKTEK